MGIFRIAVQRVTVIAAVFSVFSTGALAESGSVLFREDFESGLKPSWEKVEFEDETKHKIAVENGNSFLQAAADKSASGLAVKLHAVPSTSAALSWKWMIDRVPPGGSDDQIKTFDHTARLFVAFKTFIGPPRSINYVWANQTPVDSTFHHPSSGRSRFIVLQHGDANAGRWITEKRDVARDWKMLFGDEELPAIVAIGFMTDSDGTQCKVTGCYDDIELSTEIKTVAKKDAAKSTAK